MAVKIVPDPAMFEALLFIVVVAFIVRSVALSARLRRLEDEIRSRDTHHWSLVSRIYDLEVTTGIRPASPPPPPPESAPPPELAPSPDVAPPPTPSLSPSPTPALPLSPPPLVLPSPASESERSADWEAIVGGNWMNKIGVLILVIGIALFLGYSLTHLGPVGKIATGVLVSISMLAAGIALEQRALYTIFGRSLIGGGWAALYFTVYAMHALPAARIVTEPAAGMALLLLVAAGMILHSLRYRSQAVAGLAFAIGFVTLKISPLSMFSVFASVPLSGALLFVAGRFGWTAMATAGVVLSYGFYALHYDVEALSDVTFRAGQVVLWLYWLMFEAFDLLRSPRGVGRALMPLNACGLAGVTLLTWPSGDVAALYPFFASAALAYLADAIVRARLRPAAPESGAIDRLISGGQDAAVVISAALAAAAIYQKFTGLRETFALMIEAEFLFLAGLILRDRLLRWLGSIVFVLPVLKLLAVDIRPGERLVLAGIAVNEWTPVAAFAVAIFYVNRALARTEPPFYSYAATVLLAIVAGAEARDGWHALTWLALAGLLWLAGQWFALRELLWQAWGMVALSWIGSWPDNVFSQPPPGRAADRVSLGIGAAAFLATARSSSEMAADMCGTAGASLAAAFLWRLLPTEWTAVGWAVLAVALLIAGLRIPAFGMSAAVFLRTWIVNFYSPDRALTGGIAVAILYCGYLWLLRAGDRYSRMIFSMHASALLTALLFYEVSGRLLTIAVGAEGAALLAAGFVFRDRVLRFSGLLLFLFCVLKLFVYDLRQLDVPSRILSFVVLGLFLLAASWIYTRFREQIRRLTGE